MASARARNPLSLRNNGLIHQIADISPANTHLFEYSQLKWKHDEKLIVIADPLMQRLCFCRSLQQIRLLSSDWNCFIPALSALPCNIISWYTALL